MAEKQRIRVSEKEEEFVEKKESKSEKLRKLEALQSKLDSLDNESSSIKEKSKHLDQSNSEDGLEALENNVQLGIKNTTKGEKILQISISDLEIEKEMEALELEVAREVHITQKSLYEKLNEIHDWISSPQYGFMYAIPNKKKNKNDFESWKDEWSQVLLDYANIGKIHIIYPKRLLTEKPFNKFIDRQKSIEILAEALIEKELAKWTGKKPRNKEELRVYWKSTEEWTSILINWAEKNAIVDIVMVPDIRNSNSDFANLPIEDLKTIFERIEDEKKGTVVELDDNQFGIKFKLI